MGAGTSRSCLNTEVPTLGSVTGTKSYQGSRRGTCGWITSFLRDILESLLEQSGMKCQHSLVPSSNRRGTSVATRTDGLPTNSLDLDKARTGNSPGFFLCVFRP